jgi:hypothetical protein
MGERGDGAFLQCGTAGVASIFGLVVESGTTIVGLIGDNPDWPFPDILMFSWARGAGIR